MENIVDYVDLGRRIMQLRKKQKLTQKELSERAGVSLSFMGLIERGERKASLETIVSIANELGVGLNYLFAASLKNVSSEMKPELTLTQRQKLSSLVDEIKLSLDGWQED